MNTTTLRQYLEIRFAKVFGLLHNSLALVGVAALLVLMLQGGRYTPRSSRAQRRPPSEPFATMAFHFSSLLSRTIPSTA